MGVSNRTEIKFTWIRYHLLKRQIVLFTNEIKICWLVTQKSIQLCWKDFSPSLYSGKLPNILSTDNTHSLSSRFLQDAVNTDSTIHEDQFAHENC